MVIEGNDPSCEAYETPAYPSRLYHHVEIHLKTLAAPLTTQLQINAFLYGAYEWTRTTNTRIFNPLLYHWSYTGIGVGDRDRTCMIRICNPLPNLSATHLHKFWRLRKDSNLQLMDLESTVLPIGTTEPFVLAEDTGFEPVFTESKSDALGQAKLIPNKF